MALRRGFKSEAERIARDVRTELGMKVSQSIEPELLAELLGVEVRAGDELIPQFLLCMHAPAITRSPSRRLQPSLSKVAQEK